MLSSAASESLAALDSISVDGIGAGIAASSRRGSTSKGTEVSNLYKYFNIFFIITGNFWVSPFIRITENTKQ
jgi:hypothetical protein